VDDPQIHGTSFLRNWSNAAGQRFLVALHEQTALAGLVSIAVHGVTLLADPWLRPGLAGVLVPFASPHHPLFTAAGVVAGYLAVVLGSASMSGSGSGRPSHRGRDRRRRRGAVQ
jgi:hypothetical protein